MKVLESAREVPQGQRSFEEMLKNHQRVELPDGSIGMAPIHAFLTEYVASGHVDVVGGRLDLGNYLHMANGRIVIVPVVSPYGEFTDKFSLYVGPPTNFGKPVATTGSEMLCFYGKVSEAGGSEEMMGMMRLAHAQGQEVIALPQYWFSSQTKPGSWIQYVVFVQPRKSNVIIDAKGEEQGELPSAGTQQEVANVLAGGRR